MICRCTSRNSSEMRVRVRDQSTIPARSRDVMSIDNGHCKAAAGSMARSGTPGRIAAWPGSSACCPVAGERGSTTCDAAAAGMEGGPRSIDEAKASIASSERSQSSGPPARLDGCAQPGSAEVAAFIASASGDGANKEEDCRGPSRGAAGRATGLPGARSAAPSAEVSAACSASEWRKRCAAESSRAPDRRSLSATRSTRWDAFGINISRQLRRFRSNVSSSDQRCPAQYVEHETPIDTDEHGDRRAEPQRCH